MYYNSLCYYNHVEPIPIPPRNRQCRNISSQLTLFANILKNYFGFASEIFVYFVWRTLALPEYFPTSDWLIL